MIRRGVFALCCLLFSLHGAAQTLAKPSPNNNPNTNPNVGTTANPSSDAIGAFLDKLNDTSKATIGVATTVTSTVLNVAQEVVVNALSLIGVAYRYGGNTVEQGLDCSGFVKLVFQQSMGLVLPRRADQMSQLGSAVEPEDLRPGDLVFYNTLRRANSHVGIYIGDGQFVHAPSTGGKVRVENMSQPYWQKRFNGAKRVSQTNQ